MRKSHAGFTLIELMVVVSILGVLAAIAIPSFSIYMKRSRAGEASLQLKAVFGRAASYYQREYADPGIQGEHRLDCIVGDADNGVSPDDSKQYGTYTHDSWMAIGFGGFYGYYRYVIVSDAGPRCSVNPTTTTSVYTLRAVGDLDGDDTNSTFDLAVGANESNELYHARGFHIRNDYE
jgi:prepilin-type N-terminal cleavage/methylation domain-containing protein